MTNDHFIRTTDANHVETVRRILQKVYDAGDIYFGAVRGVLLRRLRAVLHGEGTRRREVPPARDGSRTPQGEQLLLPDGQIPGVAHPAHRGASRFHPAGTVPERGPRLSARPPGGSLHLPAEEPPHLGDHASLRRELRHLRLVRRADQLRHGDRLSGRRELPDLLARGPAPDRQGHPEAPRDLLADDAQGRRDRTLPTPERARLLERRSEQDVQEPGECRQAPRPEGQVRPRPLPLFSAPGHGLRPRFELQRGGLRPADQLGSGQRPGKPRQPDDADGRQVRRRQRAGARRRGSRGSDPSGDGRPRSLPRWRPASRTSPSTRP